MKRIISIALLSILLSYSFNQVGIFIEYVSDIETFTELYCENKDKPEMQCNGKCHLADQLAENEEQKQRKEVTSPTEIILYFSPSNVEVSEAKDFFIERKFNFYYNPNLSDGAASLIFQPPQV